MNDMTGNKKIEGGFILRRIGCIDEVCRCAEFNTLYNNKLEGATYECLHKHHPGLRWDESLYIERVTGKDGNSRVAGRDIAATVCLIPWEMDFDGVPLKTAQLEMVLTHPAYRKRGLAERLIIRFMEGLQPAGYDVSIIWGIPYYYRKYGYTYCMYGNGYETLPAANIPDADVELSRGGASVRVAPGGRLALRKTVVTDAPALAKLYDASVRDCKIFLKRDYEYWRYLIRDAKHPLYMIDGVDRNNSAGIRSVGYLIYQQPDDSQLRIIENGVGGYADGLSVLRLLKKKCGGLIHVGGNPDGVLAGLARSFGAISTQREQWLVRVTDMTSFMMKIAPVLEKRLASSGCAGVSAALVINTYKKAYRIVIADGKIVSCDDIGFKDYSMGADGGDICIPADALTRLIFGFRQLEMLTDAWPDITVKKAASPLIDALFPAASAYVSTPYHYLA